MTATETQPLKNGSSHARRRVRRKKLLPIVGFVVVVLAMIAAVVVVILSSGFTFRKPLSVTNPELFYSEVAANALVENLNTKTTKNVTPGCEATVMITRHCEPFFAKGDDEGNSYCGYLGYERAHYFSTLFGDEADSRWPQPNRLYAMSPSRPNTDKKNFRQTETLQQLADKFSLPINTEFTIGDEAKLAKAVLRNLRKGRMCGMLVVIGWRQPQVPTLAQKLGCGPYNGCPLEYKELIYDNVWQLKFLYNAPEPGDDLEVPVLGSTKSFFKHRNKKQESWEVHGSVAQMRFDPLEYSRDVGDYPTGGKAVGGSWMGGEEI